MVALVELEQRETLVQVGHWGNPELREIPVSQVKKATQVREEFKESLDQKVLPVIQDQWVKPVKREQMGLVDLPERLDLPEIQVLQDTRDVGALPVQTVQKEWEVIQGIQAAQGSKVIQVLKGSQGTLASREWQAQQVLRDKWDIPAKLAILVQLDFRALLVLPDTLGLQVNTLIPNTKLIQIINN